MLYYPRQQISGLEAGDTTNTMFAFAKALRCIFVLLSCVNADKFTISLQRWESPDCIEGKIGEHGNEIIDGECQSWDDYLPFSGFTYKAS